MLDNITSTKVIPNEINGSSRLHFTKYLRRVLRPVMKGELVYIY